MEISNSISDIEIDYSNIKKSFKPVVILCCKALQKHLNIVTVKKIGEFIQQQNIDIEEIKEIINNVCKTTLIKTFYNQEHYTKMLNDNSESWILRHRIWTSLWDNKIEGHYSITDIGYRYINPGTLIEDIDGRGFILLNAYENSQYNDNDDIFDIEIYFALVDKKYRRKGVLRQLINQFN